KALRDNMVLLEPEMRLEVTIPEEYFGAVIADLGVRRADVLPTHSRGKLTVIDAKVSLARMFDYSDKIRSLTQGRAGWTMEPSDYREVPPEEVRRMLNPDENFCPGRGRPPATGVPSRPSPFTLRRPACLPPRLRLPLQDGGETVTDESRGPASGERRVEDVIAAY